MAVVVGSEIVARVSALYQSLSHEEKEAFLAQNHLEHRASLKSANPTSDRLVLSPQSNTASPAGSKYARTRPEEALRLIREDNTMLEEHKGKPLLVASTLPRTEADMRQWFDTLDKDKTGALEKEEFKKLYASMETYGAPLRMKHLEEQMAKMTSVDGKLTFDEFVVLVSQFVKQ